MKIMNYLVYISLKIANLIIIYIKYSYYLMKIIIFIDKLMNYLVYISLKIANLIIFIGILSLIINKLV
jgi:hypothetical protein